jgi:hypothetical protein
MSLYHLVCIVVISLLCVLVFIGSELMAYGHQMQKRKKFVHGRERTPREVENASKPFLISSSDPLLPSDGATVDKAIKDES